MARPIWVEEVSEDVPESIRNMFLALVEYWVNQGISSADLGLLLQQEKQEKQEQQVVVTPWGQGRSGGQGGPGLSRDRSKPRSSFSKVFLADPNAAIHHPFCVARGVHPSPLFGMMVQSGQACTDFACNSEPHWKALAEWLFSNFNNARCAEKVTLEELRRLLQHRKEFHAQVMQEAKGKNYCHQGCVGVHERAILKHYRAHCDRLLYCTICSKNFPFSANFKKHAKSASHQAFVQQQQQEQEEKKKTKLNVAFLLN